MDRGAQRATKSAWAHKRVEHDLVTEQWRACVIFFFFYYNPYHITLKSRVIINYL